VIVDLPTPPLPEAIATTRVRDDGSRYRFHGARRSARNDALAGSPPAGSSSVRRAALRSSSPISTNSMVAGAPNATFRAPSDATLAAPAGATFSASRGEPLLASPNATLATADRTRVSSTARPGQFRVGRASTITSEPLRTRSSRSMPSSPRVLPVAGSATAPTARCSSSGTSSRRRRRKLTGAPQRAPGNPRAFLAAGRYAPCPEKAYRRR
jgi:hypothetical protein